ncbi:MAG: leucine-rich repeat domain-containing protein [Mycoplasmataceae bacterium]|nr:leucine-rich repeat domain-containing protein [Mycoplasmataceae bacterium]
MLKKTKFMLLFSSMVCITSIPFITTSCNSKVTTDYTGKTDGTDWKGRTAGALHMIFPGDGTATIQGLDGFSATNLVFPSHVVDPDGNVFSFTSLKNNIFADTGECLKGTITFQNNITSIGYGAFMNCAGITGTINLPASLTDIGDKAFLGCKMTDITIEGNYFSFANNCGNAKVLVKTADGPSFDYAHGEFSIGCLAVGELTAPSGVTEISERRFEGCAGLTKVNFPDSLLTIGNYAFMECTGITGTLSLPSNIQTIGMGAFDTTSISGTINIPASLTNIGDDVFADCFSLTNITVDPANTTYKLAPQQDVGNAQVLMNYSAASFNYETAAIGSLAIGDLVIPESVTSMATQCFNNCQLSSVIFLGNEWTALPSNAFHRCRNLQWVSVPNNVETIGERAFEDCSGLKVVTIPTSVTEVQATAFFECGNINEIYWNDDDVSEITVMSDSFLGLAPVGVLHTGDQALLYKLQTDAGLPQGWIVVGA